VQWELQQLYPDIQRSPGQPGREAVEAVGLGQEHRVLDERRGAESEHKQEQNSNKPAGRELSGLRYPTSRSGTAASYRAPRGSTTSRASG
jgi:hypothetical protein